MRNSEQIRNEKWYKKCKQKHWKKHAKNIRKPSKIDAKTDPKQRWHRKSMKNASRHFLRGHLFRHKSIFGRFLDPGRLPKWPRTRPERFKSFVNLGGVSKTVPTGSWEPPGRLSGGLRAPTGPPGAPFWDNFLTIFEVDFDMQSYSDFLLFAPAFFLSDPSLRRVTLIRATEELLINR